jgi:hypothetical protein
MLSMPDGWKFNLVDLTRRKKDGRRKTRGNLQELIESEYVKKFKITNKKGQISSWEWRLNPECRNVNLVFQPQQKNNLASKNQMTAFPDVDKSTSGKCTSSNYPEEEIIQKNIFKSNKNFSTSRKGVSENTGKILKSYEAHFSKSPKGESVWIDYLESRNDITPETASEVFNRIAYERIRLEESTGFKDQTPPTLPEVKREFEKILSKRRKTEEAGNPANPDTLFQEKEKARAQKTVIDTIPQVNPKDEPITANEGAAMVYAATGVQRPKCKK